MSTCFNCVKKVLSKVFVPKTRGIYHFHKEDFII